MDHKINNIDTETLVPTFVQSLFHPYENVRNTNAVDSSTQTDDWPIPEESEHILLLNSLSESIERQDQILNQLKIKIQTLLPAEKKQKARALRKEYLDSTLKQVAHYARESDRILQKQFFAESMMENLINDLLDLAKLEKSCFTLSQEYFNLGKIVFQALEMLHFNASSQKIELLAEVSSKAYMD